jgi:hypothetical protein
MNMRPSDTRYSACAGPGLTSLASSTGHRGQRLPGIDAAGDESGLPRRPLVAAWYCPAALAGVRPSGLLARDQVFEGVDCHRRAGIPVAGSIAAVLALLAVGQLPAVGAHLVQQLQHALPTIGEVLPDTLAGPAAQDRTYLTGADVAGDR